MSPPARAPPSLPAAFFFVLDFVLSVFFSPPFAALAAAPAPTAGDRFGVAALVAVFRTGVLLGATAARFAAFVGVFLALLPVLLPPPPLPPAAEAGVPAADFLDLAALADAAFFGVEAAAAVAAGDRVEVRPELALTSAAALRAGVRRALVALASAPESFAPPLRLAAAVRCCVVGVAAAALPLLFFLVFFVAEGRALDGVTAAAGSGADLRAGVDPLGVALFGGMCVCVCVCVRESTQTRSPGGRK